jgi:hypothetical protein
LFAIALTGSVFARRWNSRAGADPLRSGEDQRRSEQVRFNQVQYNRKDIEERVIVPSRDRLIVKTYLEHVAGRKASRSA